MVPNKGGRPRNGWTSSRRRKLVRLYTLTTLDMDEIVSVLKARQFNPSSSDVQKKLRELLPRDYAKEWKSFRPAKGQPMSKRLERLRTHQTKDASNRKRKIPLNATDASPSLPPNYFSMFEGPSFAFRDYSDSNHVSIPSQSHDFSGYEPESRVVIPSLLLLDGSTVAASLQNESTKEPSDPSTSIQDQTTDSAVRKSCSSLMSLNSLRERVKRSSSVLQHIHSVLQRLSSTSSWRSSLSFRSSIISVESLLRMQKFAGSLSDGHSTVLLAKENPSRSSEVERFPHIGWSPFKASSSPHKKPSLSEDEECVWRYLVEDLSTGPFLARPEFEGVSLEWRSCCHLLQSQSGYVEVLCQNCGIGEIHCMARSNSSFPLPGLINQLDYFSNTPLHFAAASRGWDVTQFITWIECGADIQVVNTSGATFLHVLFRHLSPEQMSQCLQLVLYLDRLKFDFARRDYHGRTALHMMLDSPNVIVETLSGKWREDFKHLVRIIAPDRSVMDNLGRNVRRIFSNEEDGMVTPGHHFSEAAAATFVESLTAVFDFDVAKWTEWLSTSNRHTWVDTEGDTALTALMKVWDCQKDETQLSSIVENMVQSGTVIHMRDRAGETALAIAARRGLRPALKLLVKLGACVNCTNYLGVSVFRGARRAIRQAIRAKNEKLYARILSCMLVLDGEDAVKHPDGNQEWAASWSPLAKRAAPLSQLSEGSGSRYVDLPIVRDAPRSRFSEGSGSRYVDVPIFLDMMYAT